jgi:hypothetical protein
MFAARSVVMVGKPESMVALAVLRLIFEASSTIPKKGSAEGFWFGSRPMNQK